MITSETDRASFSCMLRQNVLEIEDNLEHIIPDEVGVKSSVGYFACKGASSTSTSSLMELGLSLGEGTQVSDVLDRLPVRHCNEIEALRVKLSAEFPRWRLLLRSDAQPVPLPKGTLQRHFSHPSGPSLPR